MSDGAFLSRWSRRKQAARDGIEDPLPEALAPTVPAPEVPATAPQSQEPLAPLPPLDSLTPESDFAPFMRRDVDGDVRRQALKTLFADPRCNVMDGLDVYVADYSKHTPMPDGWLEKMVGTARLGDWKPPVDPEAEALPPVEGEADAKVALAPVPAPVRTPLPMDPGAPDAAFPAQPDSFPPRK